MGEWRRLGRIKQQLGDDECIEVLKACKRGVLSVLGDGGYRYGVAISHFRCHAQMRQGVVLRL